MYVIKLHFTPEITREMD